MTWMLLGGVALWTLYRLGRSGDRPGRAQWRVTATILGGVMLAGAVLAAARSAWLLAGTLAAVGGYFLLETRTRPVRAPRREEGLSEAEARATLGLDADAGRAEIQAAWKRLMARVHPDQGGAEGLAARLNAARDRLLKKK